MRHRPELALWLGCFHFGFALIVLVQTLSLSNAPLWGHPQDLALNFGPLSAGVVLISFLTGLAALNLSPMLWLLLPLGLGLASIQFSMWHSTAGILVFAAAHLAYFRADVRRILLRPELRWWSVPTRIPFEAPVFLEGANGIKVRARSFDISESGLFVQVGLDQIAKIERPGEQLSLKLTHGRFHVMNLSIDLVRMTRGSGRYPEGVGLMFKDLKHDQQKFLNTIRRQLQID